MSNHTPSHDSQFPMRRFDPGEHGVAPARGSQGHGRPLGAESQQQFSPRFLLWVFSSYWKVVIPSGVILAGIAAAALLHTYEREYEATGLLRIEDSQPYIAFKGASTGSGGSAFVRTQIELMRSALVLREVLADERVGSAKHLRKFSDRLKHLQKTLEIRQIGGSELYEVSYTSTSRQESSDVVAVVINKYIARQSGENFRQVQRVIDLLEKERARRQLEVGRLQERVIELSKQVTGKDPFGHNTMVDVDKAISPLGSLYQELTGVEVASEILRAELQSMEESQVVVAPYSDRAGAIDLEVDMSSEVRASERAIQQINDQMREYQRVSKHYTVNPNYMRLAEQLKRAESELRDYRAKLRRKLLMDRTSGGSEGGLSFIDEKRKELARLEIQERSLRRRFQEELADVQESGGKGAELEFAKAELRREEKVFEMIAARKLALQTETKAPARVTVMDKVAASTMPVESAPWKRLFFAGVLAMAAPFGCAVLREVALRRVADAEQLHQDTRLRVLGEVAAFPARRVAVNPRHLPKKLRKDMYAFAESIDALRMSLMFISPSEEHRVVAVTSAVSGEGKTSVSVALAMSFANATGARTLLIDGDMREAGVQELVDFERGPGLSDVLAGKRSLQDAVRPASGIENLFVLQAGVCSGTPHNVAQPNRLSELIEEARQEYCTVVIDTPPVLGASESLSMCRSADVTAVCALRGRSRGRQIRLAVDKLDTAGAKIGGAVLSGVPTSGYGYCYAYGYGYRDDSERSLDSGSAV